MAILVSKLKSDLRPWIMLNVPPDRLDTLQDSDFEATFNYVARDVNDLAQVRTERFYKKATTDNAEDTDLKNFLLNGRIRKIFELIYNDDNADTQFYTYTADRLVFKNSVVANSILDIFYLRDIEEIDISQGADQVDLPDVSYHEFLDLVKTRIGNDYSIKPDAEYHLKLNALVKQVIRRAPQQMLKNKEVKDTWFGVDNRYYDITQKFIGLENFVVDVNGNYTHVDA